MVYNYMENTITYEKAMEIANQFAQKIRLEMDSQAEIYLYGSVVNDQIHSKSDIDIAVVSRTFTNDVCANYARVNLLAFSINNNIDAQAIIYDDWINKTPFTTEVQRLGILVV